MSDAGKDDNILRLLRRLEWVDTEESGCVCPECGVAKPHHFERCGLAEAISHLELGRSLRRTLLRCQSMRSGYRTVQVSEEAIAALRSWVSERELCHAGTASVAHGACAMLAHDMADVLKEGK